MPHQCSRSVGGPILATLREDVPLPETLEDLRWQGPRRESLADFCAHIEDEDFIRRFEA